MEDYKNLPTVKDFRRYGRFHELPKLDLYNEIPLVLLYYICPQYYLNENKINSNLKELIKNHCIIMKEQAEYEDKIEQLKNEKELQIRRLEDQIHNFYLNIIGSCQSCIYKINK